MLLCIFPKITLGTTSERAAARELRCDLREILDATDRYKDLADRNLIRIDVGSDGYPPDLETFVKGTWLRDSHVQRVRLLQPISVDRLRGRAEWNLRSVQDDPDERKEAKWTKNALLVNMNPRERRHKSHSAGCKMHHHSSVASIRTRLIPTAFPSQTGGSTSDTYWNSLMGALVQARKLAQGPMNVMSAVFVTETGYTRNRSRSCRARLGPSWAMGQRNCGCLW
jgi:hypothetical protein